MVISVELSITVCSNKTVRTRSRNTIEAAASVTVRDSGQQGDSGQHRDSWLQVS